MSIDAPIEYVQQYYDKDHYRWATFPDVTDFIHSFLQEVDGEAVLNPGCGPQFFDYMLRFKEVPSEYVGVDISHATVSYLDTADDPRLLHAKHAVRQTGTSFRIIEGDILTTGEQFSEAFDVVVATGFIGTFHDRKLDRLCAVLHRALKPEGKLIKLTWHGPHRTPQQTADKLRFGYDSIDEHEPQPFAAQIAAAGFETLRNELFECNPETYFWDLIQGCVFKKT